MECKEFPLGFVFPMSAICVFPPTEFCLECQKFFFRIHWRSDFQSNGGKEEDSWDSRAWDIEREGETDRSGKAEERQGEMEDGWWQAKKSKRETPKKGIFTLLQVLSQYPDKQHSADTKVTVTPPPASVSMTTPWGESEKRMKDSQIRYFISGKKTPGLSYIVWLLSPLQLLIARPLSCAWEIPSFLCYICVPNACVLCAAMVNMKLWCRVRSADGQ